MDECTHEKIREAVASVPQGHVASYGDIADLVGASTPRIVGWVLKEDGFDLPWHRIVRVDGTPPPHKRQEQLQLLAGEGIHSDGRKVDMRRYRWEPCGEAET